MCRPRVSARPATLLSRSSSHASGPARRPTACRPPRAADAGRRRRWCWPSSAGWLASWSAASSAASSCASATAGRASCGAARAAPPASGPWPRATSSRCGAGSPRAGAAATAVRRCRPSIPWSSSPPPPSAPWRWPWAAPPFALLAALLGWWLLALALIDLRSWRLPDALTLPLLAAGLLAAWQHLLPGVALGQAPAAQVDQRQGEEPPAEEGCQEREGQVRGVHLEQPDVADAFARDAIARLLEHRAREVDAGDRAVARIQRGVDAGADADLEHAVARLDPHPLDRLDAAGVQRRAEREVVDRREVFVDAGDEIVFDGRDRQRTGGGVRPDDLFGLGVRCGSNSAISGLSSMLEPAQRLDNNQACARRANSSDYTSGSVSEVHRGLPARRRCCRTASTPGRPAPAAASSPAISRAIAIPSAAAASGRRPAASGPAARRAPGRPGTSLAMNSAFLALSNGKTPATTGSRARLDPLQERARSRATSKTGRVTTNSAPASTL